MKLNPQQSRVAGIHRGNHLVIAGAGCGKTATLINRISRMINDSGIDPEDILVLSFSRSAAIELKHRIKQMGISDNKGVRATTLHSFAYNLLSSEGSEFLDNMGFRGNIRIIDEKEEEMLLAKLLSIFRDDLRGMPVGLLKYLVFGDLFRMHSCAFNIPSSLKSLSLSLREQYSKDKKEKSLVDFSDLLKLAVLMLRDNRLLCRQLHEKYPFVLVDEFQDFSSINFTLLRFLLPSEKSNLCVVGDDWQAIYGFRGGDKAYLLNMKDYFQDIRLHRLTINYRSHKEIVDLGGYFIRRNKNRSRKYLISCKGPGAYIKHFLFNEKLESLKALETILKCEILMGETIAVLCRTNQQICEIKDFAEEGCGPVVFQTIHASKGAEYDSVIICWLESGVFPDRFSDIEEERRLMYVALTRSRRRLIIISLIRENGAISSFTEELRIKPLMINKPDELKNHYFQ